MKRELLESGSVEVRRQSARIISIEGNFRGSDLLIISCYAPDSTYDEEDCRQFTEDLMRFIQHVHEDTGGRYRDRVICLGDLNGEVGNWEAGKDCYAHVRGPYIRNPRTTRNGEILLEFCSDVHEHGGFVIANSFFERASTTTYIGMDGTKNSTLDHCLVSTGLFQDGWIDDSGVSESKHLAVNKDFDHRTSVLMLRLPEGDDVGEQGADEAEKQEGAAPSEARERAPNAEKGKRRRLPRSDSFRSAAERKRFEERAVRVRALKPRSGLLP